jgi:hypothetical protein
MKWRRVCQVKGYDTSVRAAKGSDPVADLLFFCSSFRDVISGKTVDYGRVMTEYPNRTTEEW